MSKIPQNDVYELIYSLSKSEKRYFKLYISRYKNDQSDLEKIFDLIDSKKIKSDYELVRLKKTPFLPMKKKRLYAAVIKSLENFHAENSEQAILRSELNQAEILTQKGLFTQAIKLLSKSKAKALKTEKHIQLLEIYKLQNEIIKLSGSNYSSEDEMESIINIQQETLGSYKNLLEYNHLNNIVYYNRKVGFTRDKLLLNKYNNLLNKKQLQHEQNAKSFEAKILFHYIKSVILLIQQKNTKSIIHFEAIIKLYDLYPERINENPERYLYNYANYISILFHLRRKDEFLENIEKLLSTRLNKKGLENDIKYVCYDQLMYFYNWYADFEKSAEFFKKLSNEVEEEYIMRRKLHRLKYYMHGVTIHFGLGEYKKSIYWINKVLNDTENISVRKDLFINAKFMAVLNYFELKEEQALSYELLSLYRHLKKSGALNKFENILVKAIKKSALATSKEKLLSYFKVTKKEFESLKEDKFESMALNTNNIIQWLESKIENKSYASVLKKNRNFL